MEKKIEDYLHLYLGCDILRPDGKTILKMIGIGSNIMEFENPYDNREMFGDARKAKPLLRPLSSMTEEESEFISEAAWLGRPTIYVNTEVTAYLLSKHFDLFNLIESGLAIDKTTL